MEAQHLKGSMRGLAAVLTLALVAALLLLAWHILPESTSDASAGQWTVSGAGILDYAVLPPQYNISPAVVDGKTSLSELHFHSRGSEIAALLRVPLAKDNGAAIPGIVLLPGAAVSKEVEQGLAKKFAEMGYATLTLDQRNLGSVDFDGDLQAFLNGMEPAEHKMVYDALAAGELLRGLPGIDAGRIIYVGESNGGRFAIIACVLDSRARGVIGISTCGYDTKAAIAHAAAAGQAVDPEAVRFYISIDPESYLDGIPPRPLVMIHSRNDTVIPYQMAERTFSRAFQPKRMHAVNCTVHGYCQEMAGAVEEELAEISQG